VFVSVFIVAQLAFLTLYGIMWRSLIQVYQSVPKDINDASKLIVQPNLMIASITRQVPPEVINKYSTILPVLLARPSSSVPMLFPLLQSAPCDTCTYLYPLLTTNFISFYSTFNQLVIQATDSSNSNNPLNIT
jgi:hypothetical protein